MLPAGIRPVRAQWALSATVVLLCAGVHAWAAPAAQRASDQTAAADPPLTELVVTGQRRAVTTSIDRKSYGLGDDLQASTGSAADAMRNLPSVTVDVDGNPSLRGDPNVQILIDGRPAPLLNAANRGAALEQMGADTIDRIEVLTNPPANFKPDGSGGVINIITKRPGKGRTATLQASAGSGGRVNLGGTAGYQLGDLNMHGALTLRRDLRTRVATDNRLNNDIASGAFLSDTRQSVVSKTDRLSKIATLGTDFDLTKIDRISAEGTYNNRQGTPVYHEDDLSLDAAGDPIGRINREQRGWEREVNSTALVKYHRTLGKDGEGLTLLAQQSEVVETQRFRYQDTVTLPAAAPSFDRQDFHRDELTREFNAEYRTALPGEAKLIAGYNLERDDDSFDDAAATMAMAGAPSITDPNGTNRFLYGQTIQALYGSYERPIGDWTVLGGLRLEQASTETNQVTTGLKGSGSYFKAYPTLHVSRDLADHQTLTLSYGHRVVRPNSEQLNPYAIRQDAFTLRAGNPNLLPQEIASYELGWAERHGATALSVTLYLRQASNAVTDVTHQVGPMMLLITKENLGKSTFSGLDFASSANLASKVDYSLSGNVGYNGIDAGNLGFAQTKSIVTYEAKGALNWHIGAKDTAQLNVSLVGKRLTPQGYRPDYSTLDLGFRHLFSDALFLTATISDILDTRRDGLIVSTPGLSDSYIRRQRGRVALIGLSWAFSGAKEGDAKTFDYDR